MPQKKTITLHPELDIDLNNTSFIADGTDTKVLRTTWQNQDVAVNIFRTIEGPNLPRYLSQIAILSMISNPYLVDFYGAFIKQREMGYVCKFYTEGNLGTLIQKKLPTAPKDNIKLLADIALGLKYLHQLEVVHSNLKSSNILVDLDSQKQYVPKLCDFGPGVTVNENVIRQLNHAYTAPEIFTENKFTKASDVYSFAIIAYELITKELPFPNVRDIVEITKKGTRPSAFPKQGYPKDLIELIKSCWQHVAAKRPTIIDISQKLQKML